MRTWDIFCRIVDNFGDIGVTWRLAKQLASEHGRSVRLWIDDMPTASKLIPSLESDSAVQIVEDVQICHWDHANTAEPADVVIEAFACDLPISYIQRMTADKNIWINLEYLSAETWVESFHARASRHSTLPLVKYFYFPGFTPHTGGLLREQNLIARRDAFLGSEATQSTFQKKLGIAESDILKVSLFCYPEAPISQLLDAFATSPEPVLCLVPESSSWHVLSRNLGATLRQGIPVRHGQLTLLPLPFLTQDEYDQLLWLCDMNFVRGEDSWIRAIWAGKPMVWQPYRQQEDTHLEKLAAFLEFYADGLNPELTKLLHQSHDGWSRDTFESGLWGEYSRRLPELGAHAKRIADKLASESDLASKLVIFVEKIHENQV